LPNQAPACHARLNRFFREWFDTKFPLTASDPTKLKPQLTGPGLNASASDTTFYDESGQCEQAQPTEPAPVTTASVLPAPVGGKVTGPATVVLTATDPGSGIASTEYKLDGGAFQPYAGPITVSALGDHTVEYRSTNRDAVVEATKSLTFTV